MLATLTLKGALHSGLTRVLTTRPASRPAPSHPGRRLRQYKVLTPAGAYVPAAMPGMADLTFKMKKIDPEAGVEPLELPSLVRMG